MISLYKLNTRGAGPISFHKFWNFGKSFSWYRHSICHYEWPTNSQFGNVRAAYCTVPCRGRTPWLQGQCSPGFALSPPEAALCLAPSGWQRPRTQDQDGGQSRGFQAKGSKFCLTHHLEKTLPRSTTENLCSFPEGEPKEKASMSALRRMVPYEALLHACMVNRKTGGQGGKTGEK